MVWYIVGQEKYGLVCCSTETFKSGGFKMTKALKKSENNNYRK